MASYTDTTGEQPTEATTEFDETLQPTGAQANDGPDGTEATAEPYQQPPPDPAYVPDESPYAPPPTPSPSPPQTTSPTDDDMKMMLRDE